MSTGKDVTIWLTEVGDQKVFGVDQGLGSMGYGSREGSSSFYGLVHRSSLPIFVPGVSITGLSTDFPRNGKIVIEKITEVEFGSYENEGRVTGLHIDVRYLE
jgi:hypothetical protein